MCHKPKKHDLNFTLSYTFDLTVAELVLKSQGKYFADG